MDRIMFYKASGEYGFLSNLYRSQVYLDDIEFPTAEHAYQYAKFRLKAAADWAMQAPSAHLVAIVGHGLFAFDIVQDWSSIKVDRMRNVLYAKFTQNADLKVKLLETRDALLIEASKTDAFWGLGKNNNGKNMLGKLLVELRQELKSEI